MEKPKSFKALIMNSEKVLFSGEAVSFSSKNETAKFDILPGHTNFISIIKEHMNIISIDNEKKEFDLEYGIVMCYENELKVFLGIKQAI